MALGHYYKSTSYHQEQEHHLLYNGWFYLLKAAIDIRGVKAEMVSQYHLLMCYSQKGTAKN